MKRLWLLCFILGYSSVLMSQTYDVGLEFQAYPTGLIPGIRTELFYKRNAYHLRLGYNWIRHGSAGVHDDERGSGVGFTLGYKRYFADQAGFFGGVKSDVWFNSMDWQDNIGTINAIGGNTKIVVIQPTAELGYLKFLSQSNFYIAPTIAFGIEINVQTKGEPVGEGLVALVGCLAGWRF